MAPKKAAAPGQAAAPAAAEEIKIELGSAYPLHEELRAEVRGRDLVTGLPKTIVVSTGEIREAIELLHAQRIGHGTTLLDDPSVVELVVARGVTLEACPTSNLHTGVIAKLTDHPLPRWLAAGVRVCVCADNTLLSDTDARRELERVATLPGMGPGQLQAVVDFGHAAAFHRS